MDTTLNIGDVQADLPTLIDRVMDGDEITITRHGRPVAVLVRADALRPRRATPSIERAEQLRGVLERGRVTELSDRGGIDSHRGDELVADLRRGRSRR